MTDENQNKQSFLKSYFNVLAGSTSIGIGSLGLASGIFSLAFPSMLPPAAIPDHVVNGISQLAAGVFFLGLGYKTYNKALNTP